MAENGSPRGERFIKLYRNVNAAIGAGALLLASVVPSPEIQTGLMAIGVLNLAQAGLVEVIRRWRKPKPALKAA